MKRTKLYLLLLPSFFIVACSPVYYVPNTVSTPLFQEEGELNLTGMAGASNHTSNVGLNSAFSISNNIGVMFNIASFVDTDNKFEGDQSNSSENLNYNASRRSQMAEIGIGYFKTIEASSNFIFETYIGYGQYSGNVAIDQEQSVSFGINRPFIQPAVGFKHKYFEMAFGARIINLYYTNVSPSSAFLANQYTMQKFNALNNKTLLEPFATLRAGTKKVKLQIQIVKALKNGNSDLAIDGVNISAGLHFQFN